MSLAIVLTVDIVLDDSVEGRHEFCEHGIDVVEAGEHLDDIRARVGVLLG